MPADIYFHTRSCDCKLSMLCFFLVYLFQYVQRLKSDCASSYQEVVFKAKQINRESYAKPDEHMKSNGGIPFVERFLVFAVTLQLFSELTEKAEITHMTTLFTIMATIVQDGAKKEPGTNERLGQKSLVYIQIPLA